MNSGIAGDDPCVNYVNYRDRLVAYHPDLIIQTLSSNDINTDIAVKGGLERFQKDGKVQLPPAPWWEPVYALSYVARTFFTALGYNELLIKIPFSTDVKDKLDKKTVELFKAYAKEVGSSGAKLIVVLQPNQGEVVQQHYDYEMKNIIPTVQPLDNIFIIDLLPYYSNEFANSKDSIGNYYWEQDGHHNSKGYFIMAKGVKYAIDSFNSSVNE